MTVYINWQSLVNKGQRTAEIRLQRKKSSKSNFEWSYCRAKFFCRCSIHNCIFYHYANLQINRTRLECRRRGPIFTLEFLPRPIASSSAFEIWPDGASLPVAQSDQRATSRTPRWRRYYRPIWKKPPSVSRRKDGLKKKKATFFFSQDFNHRCTARH